MSNISLIVPTHNRPEYVKQSMLYYEAFDGEVIYCDSSDHKYSGEILERYKYFHLPKSTFAKKMLFAIEQCSYEYISVCADDDFLIIRSLEEGLKFLESNKSFSVFTGRYASFTTPFKNKFYQLYSYDKFPKVDSNPKDNIEIFLSNYHMILWSLFRKDVLKASYEIIVDADFNNDNYIEFILAIICAYSGNMYFSNNLWGVREINFGDHWGVRHITICIDSIENKIDFNKVEKALDRQTYVGCAQNAYKHYKEYCLLNNLSIANRILNKVSRLIYNFFGIQIRNIFMKSINPNSIELNSIKETLSIKH